MKLHELANNPGAHKRRKRVGRGIGSGKGKTAGRGVKGQKARAGVAIAGFEGGQMPLHMRIPKRGFNKPGRARYIPVNLGRIEQAIRDKRLDASRPIDDAAITASGIVKRVHDGVRLLAKGELTHRIEIIVEGASAAAIAAVEKLGGQVKVKAKPEPAPDAG